MFSSASTTSCEPGRLGARRPLRRLRAARRPGVRSMITASRSVPDTPSTSAWCVLASMAQRPSSRPSTTQISHSGLERSSCCAMTRPTSLRSSLSPPGDGQRGVAQVVLDVEVRVVHPDRPPELEGDEPDLLAVARDQVELGRPPWRRRRRTAAAGPRRWRPTRCACATRGPRCGGTRRPAGSGDQDSSDPPFAAALGTAALLPASGSRVPPGVSRRRRRRAGSPSEARNGRARGSARGSPRRRPR